MESAIAGHLTCPRSRLRRVPDDYFPPVPAYVSRYAPDVTQVVMAYFGVQYRDGGAGSPEAFDRVRHELRTSAGAGHTDTARWVDGDGFTNRLCAAYWKEPRQFERWYAGAGRQWTATALEGAGTFVEVVKPEVARFETLFSSAGTPEGVGLLGHGMSGEIMEHAYWGGARDRLAASQTDALAPSGELVTVTEGGETRVHGHDAVCIIRSGQDWSETVGDERAMYLANVEPIVKEGMDFLSREGLAVGCYSNRYARVENAHGDLADRSYGLSLWRSLDALERWAESHPTHVEIFAAAMRYFGILGPAARLKLHHEVSVVRAHEQFYAYRGCHAGTGLLGPR